MTQIMLSQTESTETYESYCLCIGRWMTQILPSQTERTETYESLSMYRTLDDSNPAVSDRKHRNL